MKPTNAGGDLTDETRSASTVMVLSGSRVEIMLACGGGAELPLRTAARDIGLGGAVGKPAA